LAETLSLSLEQLQNYGVKIIF